MEIKIDKDRKEEKGNKKRKVSDEGRYEDRHSIKKRGMGIKRDR